MRNRETILIRKMSTEQNLKECAESAQPILEQSEHEEQEIAVNSDKTKEASDAEAGSNIQNSTTTAIDNSTETKCDKGLEKETTEVIGEKIKLEPQDNSIDVTGTCASEIPKKDLDEKDDDENNMQTQVGNVVKEVQTVETAQLEDKAVDGEKGELPAVGTIVSQGAEEAEETKIVEMETVDTEAQLQKSNETHEANAIVTATKDKAEFAKAEKLEPESESNIKSESELDVQLESDPNVQLEDASTLMNNAMEVPEKSDPDRPPDDEESDIFYDKLCINCECAKKHKQFLSASLFSLNYFKVNRKLYKKQYVCVDCYDQALEVYERYAGLLVNKQPMLLHDLVSKRYDFVEIDSSDDDEANPNLDKATDSGQFSTNDLKMIENELEDSLKSVFDRIDIRHQLTWSKAVLADRSRRLGDKIAMSEVELKCVQDIAARMQNTLNKVSQIEVKELPAFEISYELQTDLPSIPPAGEVQRPLIQVGGTYYAVKTKAVASWVPCRVIEQMDSINLIACSVKSYKIKYLMPQYQILKTLSAKHIAYYDAPQVRLTIGTRVIAYFDATTLARGKEKVLAQSAFYPGIIAEPLKQANKFRYLIFYDDGYTQYVQHNDVRLVCQASDKVWEDVHPASRDFIQKYVEQYSVNRPMVQTQKGQSMNTESNGTWLFARVIDIDCSLVLMQFEGPKNHTEWIYRGSLRLGPVFKEYQKSLQKTAITQLARLPRRTEPFIRYTKDMEASSTQAVQHQRALAKKSVSRQQSINTAAPSTSAMTASVRHLNNSTIYVDDENRPKGQVIFYTAKRNLPPQSYQLHKCNPGCLYKTMTKLVGYSPLAKPLLSGWERMKYKQKIKRSIVYRAPCGKSLRNIEEVRRYLRATNNVLNVENFDFCPDLHCLAEYVIESAIVQKRDISNGQEKIAIPLVNYYDNTLPPACTYAAQRIPTEGVFLNLDEEFLPGCDCEDDCSDKSKCSCWNLTIEGVRFCNPNKPIEEIGYQYKRLLEHVATGIYECNSRCKCQSNCLNRVVQHSLEMKLQVFKTSNRGWGLRCINDIPKGAFICIYAGHLLTETKANEGGIDAGDEYFADLDYIEVAEQLKEGYESDVERSDPEEEEEDTTYQPEQDDDDEFRPNKYYTKRVKHKERASRMGNQLHTGEEDSQERQVISFNPNAAMDENVRENSVRRLFDKDEAPYIMDAKTTGNLGRYFNHSCSPNLFVQNVFVDTHDLRFPWVAFFAAVHIRSGTELTWNYNYEVGVVPGKVLYCQCGAANCRIRLL